MTTHHVYQRVKSSAGIDVYKTQYIVAASCLFLTCRVVQDTNLPCFKILLIPAANNE